MGERFLANALPVAAHGKPRPGRSRAGRCQRAWLPPLVLLLALSSVFVFGGDRAHFYRPFFHDWISVTDLALADSLLAKPFRFFAVLRTADGGLKYRVYNRRPIGAFVLINLAIRPFEGDVSAQIFAARMLMLGLFVAAAMLAYFALVRVAGDRWVAAAAVLLAFSSCYALGYADAISSECSAVLFALLLVFHGMVLFAHAEATPRRRFAQLLLKACAALLLAWQVYGLLFCFLVLGVAAAAVEAWRRHPATSEAAGGRSRMNGLASLRRRTPALVAAVFGRHAVLVAVAVLFGGALLGYNVLAERSAFSGEKPIGELPSVRSALYRTGLAPRLPSETVSEPLLSAAYFRWQFHRIGALSLPYALPGLPPLWIGDLRPHKRNEPRLAAVGVAVVAACLLGLVLRRRRRMLLAVLMLSGFFWALPMRYETVVYPHDFEALSYIGVALSFFALALLAARRLARWGPRLVLGVALGAAFVFALSSKRMAGLGWDMETKVREQALLAEFEAIRERTRGSDVLIASAPGAIRYLLPQRRKFWFYMAGSVLQYQDHSRSHGSAADFVLSLERVDSESLLTPAHRFVFLYRSLRAVEEIAAARRREYQRVVESPPLARSVWDIHLAPAPEAVDGLGGSKIVFLKTPCASADTAGRFLVHVVPLDVDDLPAARRGQRFDNLDFDFLERNGVRFDDKCMVRLPLPEYDIAVLRFGHVGAAGVPTWWTRHSTDRHVSALRSAAQRAGARQPMARGGFDVYLDDRDGKTLIYIREPCAATGADAPFFLHVTPVRVRDLPARRRRAGFDNLDFRLEDVGASFDGKCVAHMRLPDYDIATVRTGQHQPGANQYDPAAGMLWRVEFSVRTLPTGRGPDE